MPENKNLIIAVALFVFAIVIFFIAYLVLRKRNNNETSNNEKSDNPTGIIAYKGNSLVVEDTVPLSFIDGKRELVEIKDGKTISKVTSIAPQAGGVLMKAQGAVSLSQYGEVIKKVNEANQKINNSNAKEKLYRVIIKQKGGVLVDSKDTKGAKRAMVKVAGKKGYGGQAELMEQSYKKAEMVKNVPKAAQIINVANAAMDVASLVVGQYYMSEINKKLTGISDSLDSIKLFQLSEFRSKIISIHNQIASFCENYSEIMENDSNRNETLQSLNNLNDKCAELLGQANDMIKNLSAVSFKKFDDYEARTSEIEQWVEYRNIIIEEMYYIAKMVFAFNRGEKSMEFSASLLGKYVKECAAINQSLIDWHKTQCEVLKIDFDEARYKKTGLKAILSAPITLFNKDFGFIKIADESMDRIEGQMTEEVIADGSLERDLFSDDIELIVKDGKLYYLPQ